MRAYLLTTAILFGLLVIVHIWRMAVEPSSRDPFMYAITVLAAALCGWAVRLSTNHRTAE